MPISTLWNIPLISEHQFLWLCRPRSYRKTVICKSNSVHDIPFLMDQWVKLYLCYNINCCLFVSLLSHFLTNFCLASTSFFYQPCVGLAKLHVKLHVYTNHLTTKMHNDRGSYQRFYSLFLYIFWTRLWTALKMRWNVCKPAPIFSRCPNFTDHRLFDVCNVIDMLSDVISGTQGRI